MPVSSSTEHWIKPDSLTINLNHFGDPDYLQVSVLAGAVVMAFKQDVIGYNAAHNYRTWPLNAANTYLETTSAVNVYAKLTRSEVNARALVVYDTVLRDIEGREISYAVDEETGETVEVLGDANPDYFYMYLGQISASVNSNGESVQREWTIDFRTGNLDTNQYRNEESTGEWSKMFRLNKVTDLIEVLKTISSAIINKLTVAKEIVLFGKPVNNIKRSTDSDHEYVLDDSGNPAIDEEGNQIKDPDYVPISDETIPTTAYLEKHGAQKYLSKIDNDTANGIITFLKGLVADGVIKAEAGATFGDTIDSMLAGKGTLITPDGRIQTDRMEVRGSALFREIIYNRLSAQEGDTSYSENGLVEEVTLEEDGTYTLKLQKRWDGDFTAFQKGDILYGDVNNLFSTGEYYTSWVWVLSVNPTANTVSVVMYGDKEVPGGVNHAPEPLMRIVKRGNAIDTTRQSYWYLSATTEKCFIWLEGVDKPMLAENNYYIMIGRPKNLSIFDNLPINYEHSYIYARGAIIQDLFRVDFQGVQVKTETPRGFWSIEVAQSDNPYLNTDDTYHTVSHYGCEWKCLVSGTLQEPKYGASDWAMLRGNPEFTIEIDSTRGWFFDVETFETTLFITGRLYNQDVTDSILDGDCSWTRDTGNVAEDNAWAVKRADAGKSIDLTLDDLGPNYPMLTGCKFKCTALLRDGQQVEIAENYVTF